MDMLDKQFQQLHHDGLLMLTNVADAAGAVGINIEDGASPPALLVRKIENRASGGRTLCQGTTLPVNAK